MFKNSQLCTKTLCGKQMNSRVNACCWHEPCHAKDPSAPDSWKGEGLSLVKCGCLLLRWKKVYTIASPSWKTAAWDGSLQSLPVDISWTAFSFRYMQNRLVQLWVESRFQLFCMHACCFFTPCHPSVQSQA